MTTTQSDFLDDFYTPSTSDAGGKPLPADRTYSGVIEAEVKEHTKYRYGQATLVLSEIEDVATGGKEFMDGASIYKIGNRKVFHRIGLGYLGEDEEKVAQANRIAKEQLYSLAHAVGLAIREKIDGKWVTTLSSGITEPDTLVKMLNGKRVEFRVKHRTYTDGKGEEKTDAQPGWFSPVGG